LLVWKTVRPLRVYSYQTWHYLMCNWHHCFEHLTDSIRYRSFILQGTALVMMVSRYGHLEREVVH